MSLVPAGVNQKLSAHFLTLFGMVFAAGAATLMINEFRVSHLLFTGVAGGLKDGQSIGDIVIDMLGGMQESLDAMNDRLDALQASLCTISEDVTAIRADVRARSRLCSFDHVRVKLVREHRLPPFMWLRSLDEGEATCSILSSAMRNGCTGCG